MTTLLANVRLRDGTTADILMKDGRIADVGPGLDAGPDAERIDGEGWLVLPGLVDGHMHLDKTLTGLSWIPYRAGPDRLSRIEGEKTWRHELPPVAERAANLVRCCIGHGSTALRTHVDMDPILGLAHLHALVEVREKFANDVDMQIVAFPQSGVLRTPGTAEVLDAAMAEGADLVGGIDPISMDGDLEGQLAVLFGIAEKHDAGVDIHLHDYGTDGLQEIAAVTARAEAHGLQGRVTVSHGFCLGNTDDDTVARQADAMAAAGVSLATHGGASSPLPPVKELRARGVTVFGGSDDVRDTWSPFGNGDMLVRAMLLAWRSGYRTDQDLEAALDCTTAAGASVLSLEGHGLSMGDRADLFTVKAETAAEAVAQHPRRGVVFKGGRLVARDDTYLGNA